MNGAPGGGDQVYDLVVAGGRLIDPGNQVDATRHLGITGGLVTAVSERPLSGREVVDATGKVVCPGFVDLHTHTPTDLGAYLAVRSGITTALELEAGAYPTSAYAVDMVGRSPVHFGASIGHFAVRAKVIEGADEPCMVHSGRLFRPGKAFIVPGTGEQLAEMERRLHEGLDAGGLGIGLLLDYMSRAIDADELQMIGEVAADRSAPIWVHVRRGAAGDPEGLDEMLVLSRNTGAPVHVCHINASAMGAVDEWLRRIEVANDDGANVTYEMFVHTAGSTGIGVHAFRTDWQERFGITYGDVQVAATGEWLTEERFRRLQESDPNATVIHHYMQEEWIRTGLVAEDMIIATDAMPCFDLETRSVPNGAGTHARILGRYVRDEQLIGLSEAVAKMALYPAERLEGVAPHFARKGRLGVGCDADLVVFDASTIEDRATYLEPYLEAVGVDHVVVGGVPVISDGEFGDSRPGVRQLASGAELD
jgi:N-acyl-D-aspartate/D-glutamate deacylase